MSVFYGMIQINHVPVRNLFHLNRNGQVDFFSLFCGAVYFRVNQKFFTGLILYHIEGVIFRHTDNRFFSGLYQYFLTTHGAVREHPSGRYRSAVGHYLRYKLAVFIHPYINTEIGTADSQHRIRRINDKLFFLT